MSAPWYDPATLTDMERGRLHKHEAMLCRVGGGVMTMAEHYAALDVVAVQDRGKIRGSRSPWCAILADDDGMYEIPAIIAKCATVPTLPAREVCS